MCPVSFAVHGKATEGREVALGLPDSCLQLSIDLGAVSTHVLEPATLTTLSWGTEHGSACRCLPTEIDRQVRLQLSTIRGPCPY